MNGIWIYRCGHMDVTSVSFGSMNRRDSSGILSNVCGPCNNNQNSVFVSATIRLEWAKELEV